MEFHWSSNAYSKIVTLEPNDSSHSINGNKKLFSSYENINEKNRKWEDVKTLFN
jgi:hypothetical protein